MPSRKQLANAVRALAMDAVTKANSGHPGAPLGMAEMAEVLWNDFLKHNPANPHWADRDRFVLSNGHASMLLYAVLHLSGYDLSIEDIKNFRQLGSKTPGHPECGETPGVETTTGPLGQGIANAVGLALAERVLAARFNRPGFDIVDHHTYVFLGDGCMMEGLSHEAASLAGTLGLGKLVALYDDNGISIEGDVQGWFADRTPSRFESCGWHVVRDVDGHNPEALKAAIQEARAVTSRPSLICCRTRIGCGCPSAEGSSSCHGAPFKQEQIAESRAHMEWEHPPFEIPKDIQAAWDARDRGARTEAVWNELFAAYRVSYPEQAAEFTRRMAGDLPEDWAARAQAFLDSLAGEQAAMATRKSSQVAINGFAPLLPELLGGSADLSGSNCTKAKHCVLLNDGAWHGNYLEYGVREFAMGAMMNGLALHGGFIPYGGTFLVFSDYARNAIRMAALMRARVIWVLTHDSIGVGEDGPTHQPYEHVQSLRLIDNLEVWRPCDTMESAVAWKCALERRDGPSALALSRQGLPQMPRDEATRAHIARGGYVLKDCEGTPEAVLMATGSEVALAVQAQVELQKRGRRVRVLSMPCLDRFEAQHQAYRDSVLPPDVIARVAVEAGSTSGWYRHVGLQGRVVGMDRFGASAPGKQLFEKFGFTVENVVAQVNALLQD
jgi:transketolase